MNGENDDIDDDLDDDSSDETLTTTAILADDDDDDDDLGGDTTIEMDIERLVAKLDAVFDEGVRGSFEQALDLGRRRPLSQREVRGAAQRKRGHGEVLVEGEGSSQPDNPNTEENLP